MRALRVAALQLDVRTGEVAANLAAAEAGLREAAARGVELVLLPEMWPTSFLPEPGAAELAASAAAVARLAELTGELGLAAAGSAYGEAEDGGLPRNRLLLHDRGRELLRYDKVHLFSPTAEDESFGAGSRPPETVECRGLRLSGLVCYDLRFPEVLRVPFHAGAELLLVPAQWPESRATQWRALVTGRAVESQCYVLACNRRGSATIGRRRLTLDFPGNSLLVGPDGVVLAEGRGEPGLVEGTLEPERVRGLRVRIPVCKDERPDLYRLW